MNSRIWFLSLLLAAATTTAASANTARLQVIHNAADPAAASVDIYVNGSLYEDDFAFREATGFRTVPAGVELKIGIAPGSSQSADEALAVIPVTLTAGKKYIAVANGVLDPSGFAANPSGRSIGFSLFPYDRAREKAGWWFLTDVAAFHGATDAPAVDIRVRNLKGLALFSGLGYGDVGGYRSVLPEKLTLDVTPAGQPGVVVASYLADLSGLRGGAAFVMASGFLNPAQNQGGAGFGLFAVLPNGTVVELPAASATARLQVIHNAADPAAATVDIYVNGALYEDDFDFREATPFRTVPAGVALNVGVAPGSSQSADDAIASFPITLQAGRTYVAMATGVLDPSAFAANPEGRSTAFTIVAKDCGRESAGFLPGVAILPFHGATDAPAVGIYAKNQWGYVRSLTRKLSYGQFSDYDWLRPALYTVLVTPAGQPQTIVAAFEANLSGLKGGAATVFASGFLDPTANQSGAAFGLFAALPDGTVLALPPVGALIAAREVGAVEAASQLPQTFELSQNFPNPFNPSTTIEFALPAEADVRLEVFNVLGQEVRELVKEKLPAGKHSVSFDASRLPSGVYFYKIQAGNDVATRRMTLIK